MSSITLSSHSTASLLEPESLNAYKTHPLISSRPTKTIFVYLKNTTRYTYVEIQEILEFSILPGIPDFDATISKCFRNLFKGTCYPSGCKGHYQAKNKAGWIYRSKGKRSSERDAEAYAIAKVRAWRKNRMAREVERAYAAASSFLSWMLQRINALSRTILNRRSSV